MCNCKSTPQAGRHTSTHTQGQTHTRKQLWAAILQALISCRKQLSVFHNLFMGDVESHLSMFHFKCAVYDRLARKEALSSCISQLYMCVWHTLLCVCAMQIGICNTLSCPRLALSLPVLGISVPWGSNGKLHLQLVPCVLRVRALTHPLVNIYPQLWLLTRL